MENNNDRYKSNHMSIKHFIKYYWSKCFFKNQRLREF